MFNQFKTSQKDSSCLNSGQSPTSFDTNKQYEDMMNAGDTNDNFNYSGNGTGNFTYNADANNNVSNHNADETNWMEEALKNPQLASSAKFLLQTMSYVNNCSTSQGDGAGPSSTVCSSDNMSSSNQPVVPATFSGQRPQGNVMNNFASTNPLSAQETSVNNLYQGSRIMNSSGRQETGTPRSVSGSSRYAIGMTNPHGNALDHGFFDSCITSGSGDSMRNQQQQQFSSYNSMDNQSNQLFPQNQVATNQSQQQVRNQGLCVSSGNFNGVVLPNINQFNSCAIEKRLATPAFDELSNLEPADYRQETSDELDLLFLLDDSLPTEFNDALPTEFNETFSNGERTRNVTHTASSSVTNASHLCPTSAPTSNACLPGSSQLMQEHLREIAQQHMQQFQIAHVEHQLKMNQKQLARQQRDLQSKLDLNVFEPLKAEAPPVSLRDCAKKPRRETGTGKATLQPGNYGVVFNINPMTKQAANFGAMIASPPIASPGIGLVHPQTELSHNNICSMNMLSHSSKTEASSTIDYHISNPADSLNATRHQYLPVVGGGMKRKRATSTSTHSARLPEMTSLYEYFESMLNSRGYSLTKLSAKEIGYMSKPSPLQSASFGFAVCSSIKAGGAGRLGALLSSGLSPNPTNKFGDSPFFLACKRGLHELVKTFVDNGADVRVADGFGRTPLHHVAWSNDPCFTSAKILLEADARLICVTDNFGKTPLDFVVDSNRLKWLDFLESIKDSCWPPIKMGSSYAPEAKNGGLMPDPPNALPIELAEKVASGHVLPEEARRQASFVDN
ncbi:hypothetical protein HJC23_001026 [Cyclotella cryptica]|uniref:Uncharacterized protein n=1 Tax=Cyclotella cryptica TaxID=29204 RepID=A0ABD3P455_9STRA|eukprot:CCRYP_018014-RA/>CCRYP_018014-RA protein AED:0.05 eAED:0.05 QI:413/1/1/1/0.5/0.66/3/198/787